MVQQRLVLVRVGLGLLQVAVRDLGHVADHVGEGAAERIDPHLAHVGRHAGQLGARMLTRENSSQVMSSITATGAFFGARAGP